MYNYNVMLSFNRFVIELIMLTNWYNLPVAIWTLEIVENLIIPTHVLVYVIQNL